MSGVECVEHGNTHGPGSVLHTLAQGRAQFSGQRLVTTEIRLGKAPGQEGDSVWAILTQLKALRERLQEAQSAAVEKSKEAARVTDDYVHDHPWRSILAAASLGLVVGVLIARR